jgi:hypothetical protein
MRGSGHFRMVVHSPTVRLPGYLMIGHGGGAPAGRCAVMDVRRKA